MTLQVLHDIHAGAIRAAGTTNSSAWELRLHILSEFQRLLPTGKDLMLLGDLFDTNNVPVSDVLKVYLILVDWLKKNPSHKLYNVLGNHDASKTSNVLSSFQFLGKLLSHTYPAQYVHIEAPTMTPYGYVIPHMLNQDVFNIELAKVPECNFLFLHCNYDNFFAAQADQSLNVSEKQALESKAHKLIFAHEHHGRNAAKVLVPGNQIASSVSDWLSNQDKRFITVEKDGSYNYTWCATRSLQFAELEWDKLEATDAKFIRIAGAAPNTDAAAVVNAVNKYRKSSEAFVITNGVAIQTTDTETVNFEATLQNVQRFSVLEALRELMTTEEMAVLEDLLKG